MPMTTVHASVRKLEEEKDKAQDKARRLERENAVLQEKASGLLAQCAELQTRVAEQATELSAAEAERAEGAEILSVARAERTLVDSALERAGKLFDQEARSHFSFRKCIFDTFCFSSKSFFNHLECCRRFVTCVLLLGRYLARLRN